MIFSDEEKKYLDDLKAKTGNQRSLVLPALWIVQRKQGYISPKDILEMESELGIPAIFFSQAVGFFAMFNETPKGKYELKFCRGLSCELLGAEEMIKRAQNILGIKKGETSADGLFSLCATECLGYCEKAPAMLVNLEQYANLDEQKIQKIIEDIRMKNASSKC